MFESGVGYYTVGIAEVPVGFPEGEVKCKWCRYLRYEEAYKRHSCRFTDEWIVNPFGYELGRACPIVFENTEKE